MDGEFELELDEEGLISSISCVMYEQDQPTLRYPLTRSLLRASDSSGVRFPKLDLQFNGEGISTISTGVKVKNI